MSRAERRRAGRDKRSGRTTGGFNKAPIWIMSGSVVAALLVVALVAAPGGGAGGHHPTPRADAHEMHMMPEARYAGMPGVGEVYRYAAEIPAVMDGIYCYCECLTNFGHYSLLECFMNDHAAACDICLREAILAYQMTTRGDDLDAIRQEVDRRYRT